MKSANRGLLFTIAVLTLTGCGSSSDTMTIMKTAKDAAQEESQTPAVMETNEDYNYTVLPQDSQEEEKILTIDKILELSGKEDLGWEDFENYPSRDVGSGLRILKYAIDDQFCLLVGGPDQDGKPMYIRLVSLDDEDYAEIRTDDVESFISCHTPTANYVGIRGHIKEIQKDQVLVSSDTDEFPGVFWVLGIQEPADSQGLKGGTSVFVRMKDMEEKGEDGIARYRAETFFALPEEENRAVPDILLTDAPPLALTDVLSSTYDSFEIRPGNYTWSSEEHGEGTTVVACGTAPLDEAASENRTKLKLPRYNGIDYAGYSFSTKIQPDKLTVRQWSAEDIGSAEAKEESISIYYYVIPFLDLRPGKVYEFTAEWNKENQERNQCSGIARYVLVTE